MAEASPGAETVAASSPQPDFIFNFRTLCLGAATPSPASHKAGHGKSASLSPEPSARCCQVAMPATGAAVKPYALRSAAALRASAAAADVAVQPGSVPAQPAAGTPPATPVAAAPDSSPEKVVVVLSNRVPETGDGGDSSVRILQQLIEIQGYPTFVGEENIQGGDNWVDTIQNAIEECKAFVIMCSPTYGHPEQSPWTKRELDMAVNEKKVLLPVWHNGPYPPPNTKLTLSGMQRFPAGNFKGGYVAAGISHERVADVLVAALKRKGIQPSRSPRA